MEPDHLIIVDHSKGNSSANHGSPDPALLAPLPQSNGIDLADIKRDKLNRYLDIVIDLPKRPPTWLEAFLGVCFDKHQEMVEALTLTEAEILALNKKFATADDPQERTALTQDLNELNKVQESIKQSLSIYTITTGKQWLYQWSVLTLLSMTTFFLLLVVEVYLRWHGTSIFRNLTHLYDAHQVDILSKINFVNGPTTLSIALEIMVWSSVGVWAQQAYNTTRMMVERTFRFGDHGPMYVGIMMRNTGVAAAVILLLRLTQFSIFGISLNDTSPFAFDATIGLAFLLGFFGDDATNMLSNFRDVVVGRARQQNHADDEAKGK